VDARRAPLNTSQSAIKTLQLLWRIVVVGDEQQPVTRPTVEEIGRKLPIEMDTAISQTVTPVFNTA